MFLFLQECSHLQPLFNYKLLSDNHSPFVPLNVMASFQWRPTAEQQRRRQCALVLMRHRDEQTTRAHARACSKVTCALFYTKLKINIQRRSRVIEASHILRQTMNLMCHTTVQWYASKSQSRHCCGNPVCHKFKLTTGASASLLRHNFRFEFVTTSHFVSVRQWETQSPSSACMLDMRSSMRMTKGTLLRFKLATRPRGQHVAFESLTQLLP